VEAVEDDLAPSSTMVRGACHDSRPIAKDPRKPVRGPFFMPTEGMESGRAKVEQLSLGAHLQPLRAEYHSVADLEELLAG
jgi:hypothetical protein